MEKNQAVEAFNWMERLFQKTISIFEEKDSGFRPAEGTMTLAEQMRHVTNTIKWFNDGALTDKGYNMDFEAFEREMEGAVSFEKERELFKQMMNNARELWGKLSAEEMEKPLPPNPVFGEVPVYTVVPSMTDHTAHHRGSLAIYARTLGKVPPMPYGEA